MQRVGLDLLPTSVVRDLAEQLGVKDTPIDITAPNESKVMDPVEKLVHEIGMNALRIRGVCSEEGLEAAREEFNSTIPTLDKAFQVAVEEDPDNDENLTEIIREYVNTMQCELYGV